MTWDPVKLGDICDFQNGFAFKSSLFKEAGKPILRISNIQNQTIDTNKIVFFNPENYEIDFAKYEVKPNDLLIAMSGATTGKIGFNDTDTTFYLNQRLGNLKPNSSLDKKYLYYFLSTKVEENLKISKGAAQPNLSSEQIKNIDISLPPLSVQKQIVEKLDEAFADIDKAISATEKNIENRSKLFQVFIDQSLEDNSIKAPLENVAEIINGHAFKSPDFNKDGKIKCIKITNVGINKFVETDEYLPEKFSEKYQDFLINSGTIVLALTRTIIKDGLKVAVVPLSYDKALLNQRVAAIHANNSDLLQSYLYLYFCSSIVETYVKNNVQSLMQPNLSIKDLRKLPVPIPNLSTQENIVFRHEKLLVSTNKLLKVYEKKLFHLNALKSSILNQAFSGELIKDAA